MFEKTKKLHDKISELTSTVETLEYNLKSEKTYRESEEERYMRAKRDFESQEKILRQELDTEISKATTKLEKEKTELKIENGILRERVQILEKAFENLGFDVKDMKGILDKLADAVVAKNEVKVIK